MSAADGSLTPGAPHAELEQRYRRLLRLYPRDFRARRMDEMIGVLMASAADGQNRPARADVSAIVRGSLLERLRGPRGGWSLALSAFALVAPLFLILTDILQVAFPSSESQAAVQSRIGALGLRGVPAVGDMFRNGQPHAPSGNTFMVIGCVLALLAVLLPLPLGLGWRASLLLAAACYPLVILAAAHGPSVGRLPQTLGMGPMPAPEAHTVIVTILYLPPLLVLCRAVAQTIRTRRPRNGEDLAA